MKIDFGKTPSLLDLIIVSLTVGPIAFMIGTYFL